MSASLSITRELYEAFEAALNEMREIRSESILSGSVEDYTEYRKRCGALQGHKEALEVFQQVCDQFIKTENLDDEGFTAIK